MTVFLQQRFGGIFSTGNVRTQDSSSSWSNMYASRSVRCMCVILKSYKTYLRRQQIALYCQIVVFRHTTFGTQPWILWMHVDMALTAVRVICTVEKGTANLCTIAFLYQSRQNSSNLIQQFDWLFSTLFTPGVNIQLRWSYYKWTAKMHSHSHLALWARFQWSLVIEFHTLFPLKVDCHAHLLCQSSAAFIFRQKCPTNHLMKLYRLFQTFLQ